MTNRMLQSESRYRKQAPPERERARRRSRPAPVRAPTIATGAHEVRKPWPSARFPDRATAWAALSALMQTWKRGESVGVEAAVPAQFADAYREGKGLSSADFTTFANDLGLALQPVDKGLDARALSALLSKHGPLWLAWGVPEADAVGSWYGGLIFAVKPMASEAKVTYALPRKPGVRVGRLSRLLAHARAQTTTPTLVYWRHAGGKREATAMTAKPARKTTSTQGVAMVEGFEGFSAELYSGPGGHCHIGFGHKLHSNACDGRHASEQPYRNGITRANARVLLAQDLRRAEGLVHTTVTVALTQAQFDALVSFIYNIGSGAWRRSTLLVVLNKGQLAKVPTEMARWLFAGGVKQAGLVKRRKQEGALFSTGVYP